MNIENEIIEIIDLKKNKDENKEKASNENQMYMDIKNEVMMQYYVETDINYLVVYPNRDAKIYKTLKDIQEDICINTSTISKKIKKTGDAIFKAKGAGYIFYIRKLN